MDIVIYMICSLITTIFNKDLRFVLNVNGANFLTSVMLEAITTHPFRNSTLLFSNITMSVLKSADSLETKLEIILALEPPAFSTQLSNMAHDFTRTRL